MHPAITAAIYIVIGMISVSIPAVLFIRPRERAFQKVTDAYERIILQCDARTATADARTAAADVRLNDYMNRYYASQNLPVSGVDMLGEHKERKERDRARREERDRAPAKIGLVDQGQERMALAVASGAYETE